MHRLIFFYLFLLCLTSCTSSISCSNYEFSKQLRGANLKNWADIYEAKSLEKKKKFSHARELYKAIPDNVAPSLDARLGIIRIDWLQNNQFNSQQVALLEKDSKVYRRDDILKDIENLKSEVFPPKPSLARPEERPSVDLLESAKQLWNKNENEKALKILSQILVKPKSQLENYKALYMKARIHHELKENSAAKTVFYKILKSEAPAEVKINSLKHLAWMHLKEKKPTSANQYFIQGINVINQEIKKKHYSPNEVKKLTDDLPYFYYWAASTEKNSTLRNNFFKKSSEYKPLSYYSFLCFKEKKHSSKHSFFEIAKDAANIDTEIFTKEDYQLIELLTQINSVKNQKISEISTHEINWKYPDTPETYKNLKNLIALASLYNEFSTPDLSVKLTESSLLQPHRFSNFSKEEILKFAPEIINLSFPLAYREVYNKAENETNVPQALLYAISRTESYFDTNARSTADARGVMQLLPQTAELEGGNSEDLYTPEINIILGARHLNRLLKKYNQNEILAIAAYNAGSNAVDRWVSRNPVVDTRWIEEISFQETRNYVKKVLVAKSIYEMLTMP